MFVRTTITYGSRQLLLKQAHSSSGPLTWNLITLKPNRGPWTDVRFEAVTRLPTSSPSAPLAVGMKVTVMRDCQKTQCLITKVNLANKTVELKVDPDQYAPVAQTCTFTLKVPEYSSADVTIKQLRRALVEKGMHLD